MGVSLIPTIKSSAHFFPQNPQSSFSPTHIECILSAKKDKSPTTTKMSPNENPRLPTTMGTSTSEIFYEWKRKEIRKNQTGFDIFVGRIIVPLIVCVVVKKSAPSAFPSFHLSAISMLKRRLRDTEKLKSFGKRTSMVLLEQTRATKKLFRVRYETCKEDSLYVLREDIGWSQGKEHDFFRTEALLRAQRASFHISIELKTKYHSSALQIKNGMASDQFSVHLQDCGIFEKTLEI